MPAERALSRAIAATSPALIRLFRFGVIAVLAVFVLFCALLLAVRFVVFPRAEAYRDTVTAALSRQLGQPVEIDGLTTGWDGWNPKLVVHGFRVRDHALAAAVPLLELPEIEMIVAWTSLPLFDLRLKQLSIERPRIALRRDTAGKLHIAGMEIDPEHPPEDAGITDWVLRQPQIVIHDAQITWNDEKRVAPPLVLDRVQLLLESGFGRHRFGLRGTPPGTLAGPIDVRGDLRGVSSKDWHSAAGRLYVRLDYADVAAWHQWLPLPVPIASGKGALRVWFEFAGDEPKEIIADLELAGVKAKLGADLKELELDYLSGRAGWRVTSSERTVYARQLGFVTTAGQRLLPTDFSLTMRDADGGNAATGLLEFERLQLAPLRDFAVHLPLPERVRIDLDRYAPRGTLTHGRLSWEGPVDQPAAFNASADFTDLGIVAQESLPGTAQLTGHLDATQAGGKVKLASHNAVLELPRIFADPIALASVSGDVIWERKDGRTTVKFERMEFANADASGQATGQYRTTTQGPGEIDLNAQLMRVDVAHLYRYIPTTVGDSVRQWLRSSLTKGRTDEVRLKLTGNLAAFPFADGKSGQFSVLAKGRDLSLDYARNWPAISAADAEVRIDGTRLTVDLARGRIADVPLDKAKAEIADMRFPHPLLRIDGDVSGPTTDFLRFVNTSPVAGWIDHFADGIKASGNGRLNLKLELPLGDPSANKVAGDYLFIDNQVNMPGVPALTKVNGKLVFSGHDMRTQDLAADVFGGPARFTVTSADGRVRVNGNGASNVAAMRREYDVPYGDVLSGTLDWTIVTDATPQGSTWTLASSMKGTAVDLPVPVGKAAADAVALKVERHFVAAQPNEDTLTVDYGSIGRLLMHRKLAADGAAADRALLLIGPTAARSADARADRPGLWMRGELASMNADDWLTVRRRAKSGSGDIGGLTLAGADVDVGVLDAFGREFRDMKLVARRAQDDWRLDLKATELAGTATWVVPNTKAPNGRIVARLSRLTPPGPGAPGTWKAGPSSAEAKTEAGGSNPWPEINVESDSYLLRGRDIGRLQLIAHPRGTDWQIDKLALSNEAGRIDADGLWRVAGSREQTKLDFVLDVKDAGAYLLRLGYPDAIKTGPTKINGKLEWAGAPSAFDYPTLGGAFRIETGPGRFTKIDPGVGKLLGVLSLQALPRRMALDFTDVFSEGFAFDQIVGDVTIQNGVMKTSDLRLTGPAARVSVAGEADLAKETQQLTVRVHPSMSGGVGAGAALLMLANPIVGAAVGVGSLLARQAMHDPVEQMFSYEYRVTGSWSDPIVGKRGRVTAAVPAEPAK